VSLAVAARPVFPKSISAGGTLKMELGGECSPEAEKLTVQSVRLTEAATASRPSKSHPVTVLLVPS
jgi:hypothetical protein